MKIKFNANLTKYQENVMTWLFKNKFYNSGKIAVIKSVRQSGKSYLLRVLLIRAALERVGTSVYVAPTLLQSREMYNNILKALGNTELIESANASILYINFINGSVIHFRSTAQNDTVRGLTASSMLVLDECAYLDEESIYTILPLANVHNCPIVIASTPFTKDGYFYNMYISNDQNVKAFDWSKEPEISRFLTDDRKQMYKQVMSRAKYTTEILGEFLNDEGLLFTNLSNCILDYTPAYKTVYVGIDFGTGSGGDYTVVSIMNDKGEQVALHRNNNLSPMQQVDWIASILNQYKLGKVLAEQNSIGKLYIDALNSRLPIKITNWTTSNKSKHELVTNFQIALENERVKLINDSTLMNELKKYTQEINPKTKTITYNGKNAHDDTVIATMLSYYAISSNSGQYTIYKKGRKL